MTTDTSKAPERIHLGTRPTRYNYGFCYIDADLPLTTEYVRSDIHDAMQDRAEKAEADNERLRDALETIAAWDWIEVEPCGSDIPENVEPWARELDDTCAQMQRIARKALERKEGT